MQKRQLITVIMFFFGMLFTGVHAQTHSVSGVVKDKVPGNPLVGVTVTIKGSSTATVTDINGNYSIQASPSDALVFSYISMNTVEEKVGNRQFIDVTMVESDESLGEVVVTALGIKREAKSLAYSAQTVGGKDVNEIKSVNMINSLQGKSAGLTITPNATGAGGASKILFRGSKSISGSNQPLVVLDGVPLMMNISDVQVNSNYGGQRDGGDVLSQINPDDIAQITLLKGASAAALYGAVAANGAIMITTKSAQAGKVSINVSSNTTIETPISLPKFQTTYGMSDSGTYSWGSKLSAKADDYAKNFYRTGFTTNNSVSVAGGNEHISSYFSYGNVRSNGIVPENNYDSHNLLAKVGFEILPKLHLDASASLNKQHIKNQMAAGFLNNPLTGAYLFPRGENWNDYKDNYEVYDPVLNTNVQRWTNVKQEQFSNPYWMLHRQVPVSDRNRYEFGGSLKYEIIDGLSVMGRLRFERGDERWVYNEFASSTGGRNLMGTMKDSRVFSEQFYGDLLATYNHIWSNTYALTLTAGTSFTKTKGNGAEVIGWGDSVYKVIDGKPTGNAYYPNIFTPSNYYRLTPNFSQRDKRLNSIFGTAQFGYKDGLFIDVTARNDWSSALAFTDGVSFFYPSVGTSLLLDKFINFGHNVNMLKLRASYSVVGNDVPVFMSNLRYTLQDSGSLTPPERAPFRTLKPEKTHSIELGIEGSFFENRLETNITYYKTTTKNQFFAVDAPWETGLRQRYVNAGNVRNQGVEVSLTWYQQFGKDLSWTTRFNYAYNANKIVELVEGLKDLTLANYGSAKVVLKEGGHYGDLYVRQVNRDEHGKPIVDAGAPQLGGDGNDQLKYAGEMNPRTTVGWSNSFNYKDFTLSFLIDGKFGGKILSMTEATLDGWGVSERSGAGRDAGKVVLDGQEFDAAKYYKTIGATNFNSQYAAEMYLYKATNIRLRELSLGYTFRNLFGHNKNLTASLIARNLFFFYKDAPIDPDVSLGTGNGWQGVDIFSLPSSRSMGLNLKLNF